MILKDALVILLIDRSFINTRCLVAKVLLENVNNKTTKSHLISKRDIASLIDTDWGSVHASLKSLQDEGAISIERHQISINKGLLQKIAGAS
jgi:hypothetical protein